MTECKIHDNVQSQSLNAELNVSTNLLVDQVKHANLSVLVK